LAETLGPFLGNGSVNTFPLLDNRFLITQQLDYKNVRVAFSTYPCRNVSKGQAQLRVSSVQESVNRELKPEAEEYVLLKPLPGNVY
jgi:hypothetical protein